MPHAVSFIPQSLCLLLHRIDKIGLEYTILKQLILWTIPKDKTLLHENNSMLDVLAAAEFINGIKGFSPRADTSYERRVFTWK